MTPSTTEAARHATARFDMLLDRAERLRARALPFDELAELGRLYRRHLAHLARARARSLDAAAVAYLNGLCMRAHTVLYVPAGRESIARFVWASLPAALAGTWRAQVLAWALLASGMLVGGMLVARDPEAVRKLVPTCMCSQPDQFDRLARSRAARVEFFERRDTPVSTNLAFGSLLFTHNTRVGLLSFATGILAAVPTILLQVYNGIVIGAFSAIFFRDPWPLDYLAWILPHGIPELTAVTLCAAGGLVLGGAVAAPGRRSRSTAVRAAVLPALALFAGALPLFALAAVTESFVRESMLGTATRLAIAAVYTAALLAGLAWMRERSRRSGDDGSWLGELMRPRLGASPGTGSEAPT